MLTIIALAVFSKKIRKGFFGRLSSRVKINDVVYSLDEFPKLNKNQKHNMGYWI